MNATKTQKLSWAEMITSGRAETESSVVYAAIRKYGPCNYHKIRRVTGLPINHAVRAINDLTSGKKGPALVEVSHEAKSQESGRMVQYYRIVKQLRLAL